MDDVAMKRDRRCPKCGHGTVLWIKRALPRLGPDGFIGGLAFVQRFDAGWGLHTSTTVGEVEAYVCESCGFIELYATSPIPVDGEFVERLTADMAVYR